MNERVYTRTHAERLALVEQMKNNGKWHVLTQISSSANTYYLFGSIANPWETIGINDGESDFYEDVIYSY